MGRLSGLGWTEEKQKAGDARLARWNAEYRKPPGRAWRMFGLPDYVMVKPSRFFFSLALTALATSDVVVGAASDRHHLGTPLTVLIIALVIGLLIGISVYRVLVYRASTRRAA